MVQVALGQSLIDELGSALYLTGLVGVLNAQDKGAPALRAMSQVYRAVRRLPMCI